MPNTDPSSISDESINALKRWKLKIDETQVNNKKEYPKIYLPDDDADSALVRISMVHPRLVEELRSAAQECNQAWNLALNYTGDWDALHATMAMVSRRIGVAVNELSGSRDIGGIKPKRPKKRGRRTGRLKTDRGIDAKLYIDWKASGMKIAEFSRERNLDEDETRAAINRHKNRVSRDRK